ncbi:hypothetical protein MS5N3_05230 [Marinobacter salsuginis]|uniref:Uncharacterized protein n=1 Tax=Marinobacter salsuginis TaxID=418719 RepID=A0A5M3PJH9_9GAMM|nr:hypothetical protein MS5N3_05230 [Marinobacter salsuginis]
MADQRVFYLVDWHGVTCVSGWGFSVAIKWRKDTASGKASQAANGRFAEIH